ncbi:rodlin [Streptomyces sp. JJ38]|uniref:rodlin n=1 Tax=Streptomyces sp. JJ38 TaxID=2738128 RepID=UPI001C591BC0|nr:rodlin [Streptomyces sp. JJ38]MBW1598360.1 RdlA protein [Streptomyces sp. JJ38]
MIKKVLATAAVAASVVGVTGVAASPALATGDDWGHETASGNGSKQVYGNTTTGGYMSPNMSLVNGSLNKPCVAVPDVDALKGIGLVGVNVEDILTSKNYQTCTENSTQVDGDDPLSHILSDLSLLSENASLSARG